jgi:hypothetical protein
MPTARPKARRNLQHQAIRGGEGRVFQHLVEVDLLTVVVDVLPDPHVKEERL